MRTRHEHEEKGTNMKCEGTNMRSRGTRCAALVASLGMLAGASAAATTSATTAATDDGASAAATTTATTAAGGSGAASGDPCGFDQALVDAAKEEGKVSVVGSYPEEDARFLGDLFNDAYGIDLVYNRQPTADAVQQVDTALEAGALTFDAALVGDASPFLPWTTGGKLAALDPPNGDAFIDGLRDGSRDSLPVSVIPMGVIYNSSRLDEADAIRSWAELNDKRDGKVIALADPSTSGSSLAYHYVLAEELGDDYLMPFEGERNHITESGATLTQLVLSGEVDFAAPGYESEVVKARKTGEPLDVFFFDEVVPVTLTEIGVFAEAPHPNAGRLFAEFLVCDTVQHRLRDIGQRPSIEGAPLADGLQDLSNHNLVSPNIPDMIANRETVVARFDAATG